jgi:YggT family protein
MLGAIINGINSVISLYIFIILVYCVLTWIPNIDWYKQPAITVKQLVEPYLNLFKRIIPPVGGMLDISPIAATIVLIVLQNALGILLMALAQ